MGAIQVLRNCNGGSGHNSMRSLTEVYDSTLLVLGGGDVALYR